MINPIYSEISESVTDLSIHSSSEFYLKDFVNNLTPDNITKLISYDAEIAVLSQAYNTKNEYYKSKYNISKPEDASKNDAIDLLQSIVMHNVYDGGHEEGFEYILNFLDAKLTNPNLCAHFMSRKCFFKTSLRYTKNIATDLYYEINGTPRGDQVRNIDDTLYNLFCSYVDGDFKNLCTDRFMEFEHLYTNLSVEERHPLYPTKYSLILPQERNKIVLKPIQQIIIECSKYPKQLYSLKPREFEKFLAEIFIGFGFEVNLTAQTRDGGADII